MIYATRKALDPGAIMDALTCAYQYALEYDAIWDEELMRLEQIIDDMNAAFRAYIERDHVAEARIDHEHRRMKEARYDE